MGMKRSSYAGIGETDPVLAVIESYGAKGNRWQSSQLAEIARQQSGGRPVLLPGRKCQRLTLKASIESLRNASGLPAPNRVLPLFRPRILRNVGQPDPTRVIGR
jgi:hypothetical protein